MLSLESPHRGDSNENTQYNIFNIKKKTTINYSKSAALGFCSKGLKNEFETAVVNEPSMFEPPKFYCNCFSMKHEKHLLISLFIMQIRNKMTTVAIPTFISRHTSKLIYCLCVKHRKKDIYSVDCISVHLLVLLQ